MKMIQVVGPGCAKCQKLYEHAKKAAEQLGIDFDIEKVTELDAILALGVVTTPALIVDGQIKVAGRVPSADQIKAVLT